MTAIPSRPGTYPYALGFRRGVYINDLIDRKGVGTRDWSLMPSGRYAT